MQRFLIAPLVPVAIAVLVTTSITVDLIGLALAHLTLSR